MMDPKQLREYFNSMEENGLYYSIQLENGNFRSCWDAEDFLHEWETEADNVSCKHLTDEQLTSIYDKKKEKRRHKK